MGTSALAELLRRTAERIEAEYNRADGNLFLAAKLAGEQLALAEQRVVGAGYSWPVELAELQRSLSIKGPAKLRIQDRQVAELLWTLSESVGEPSAMLNIQLTEPEQFTLDAIRKAGRRLTGEELLPLLGKRLGEEPAPGTMRQTWAAMVRHRLLSNGDDEFGKGYGLPNW